MDAERRLVDQLAGLESRLEDERFCTDLYRALAGATWERTETLVLSWGRAEEVVNELRARSGQQPLALAQSGHEGEVSRTVADELGALGWRPEPRRTDADEPLHRGRADSPPRSREHADWERLAHEEAAAEVARRRGIG